MVIDLQKLCPKRRRLLNADCFIVRPHNAGRLDIGSELRLSSTAAAATALAQG
jgi:hypothetical protein